MRGTIILDGHIRTVWALCSFLIFYISVASSRERPTCIIRKFTGEKAGQRMPLALHYSVRPFSLSLLK